MADGYYELTTNFSFSNLCYNLKLIGTAVEYKTLFTKLGCLTIKLFYSYTVKLN